MPDGMKASAQGGRALLSQNVKLLLTLTAGFVTILLVTTIVGETADVVELSARIHPLVGTVVLWTLLLFYVVVAAWIGLIFMRLRRRPRLPDPNDKDGIDRYQTMIRRRLVKNRAIRDAGIDVTTAEGYERAIALLDERAKQESIGTAKAVFVSTAVSQSGRLDGLMVLGSQVRMIWRIARIYNQRPYLDEMVRLYGAIAATVLVAVQIEDTDIEEQLEPMLGALLVSLTGAVPGLEKAATILATSILDGGFNAFLTLRIGSVTRRYCATPVALDRIAVRHEANHEASRQLQFAVSGAMPIVKSAIAAGYKRSKSWTSDRASAAATGISNTVATLKHKLNRPRTEIPQDTDHE